MLSKHQILIHICTRNFSTTLNVDVKVVTRKSLFLSSSFKTNSDMRFILSKIPDGGLLIGADAEVRPLPGAPPPALHEAFIEAGLEDLGLAPY